MNVNTIMTDLKLAPLLMGGISCINATVTVKGSSIPFVSSV